MTAPCAQITCFSTNQLSTKCKCPPVLSTNPFSPSSAYELIIVLHLWICVWQEAPPPGCCLMAAWRSSTSFSDSYHSRHAGRGRVPSHTAQYVVFRIRPNSFSHDSSEFYIVTWSLEDPVDLTISTYSIVIYTIYTIYNTDNIDWIAFKTLALLAETRPCLGISGQYVMFLAV